MWPEDFRHSRDRGGGSAPSLGRAVLGAGPRWPSVVVAVAEPCASRGPSWSLSCLAQRGPATEPRPWAPAHPPSIDPSPL